ncbi:ester cyclase [Amycolatopsis sp. CA-126428]|uniref:ester cyclase n=1 Tax=Amycolatopsis sp. CA-126428 TaxID=2073158 RepID=UPI000CD04094|nr:ester cyclase [Amycolatopsis sp. CA-126428]
MTPPPSPAEVNRAILAARAAGDFEAAANYIAADSRDQGRHVTRADWRRKWEGLWAGVPDFDVVVESSVENGEWVANRYTVRGTHTGDFFGRPPTGQRFEVTGMDMIRVVDGHLVEHWMVAESF